MSKDAFATRLLRYLKRLALLPHSAAEAAERSRRIEALLAAASPGQGATRGSVAPPVPIAAAMPAQASPPSGPRLIPLAELNAVLDEAVAKIGIDYAAGTDLLNAIIVDLPPPPDIDPFGPDYARWVMDTYLTVTGFDRYDPARNEADLNVSVDLPLPQYFPFSTGDDDFIGRYLGGVGLILSSLGLPARSRIVEYGSGWGHVATALARAGHHVTCVDIEPKLLALAARQAAALGCTIATHHGAFGESPYPPGAQRAAAVVFSEAFHHAFDHLGVLRMLRSDVLAPGGVLILAAEPVYPHFYAPWGIRPDGHALWAVRRNGWMELGFRESFLLAALLREGFVVTRTQVPSLGPFGLLYRAQLHEGLVRLGETLLPTEEEASWAPARSDDQGRRWTRANSVATLDHDRNWSTLTVDLWNDHAVPYSIDVSAGEHSPVTHLTLGPNERHHLQLDLPDGERLLRIRSTTLSSRTPDLAEHRRGVAVETLRYGR